MKKTLIILIAILTSNCSTPKKKEESTSISLDYKILNEKIMDNTASSKKVIINLIIHDTNKKIKLVNDKMVKNLLYSIYNKKSKEIDVPITIGIYVYLSKEKAESGMAQWLGMLSKSYTEGSPRININEAQLKYVNSKPTIKYGLAENKRKEIWGLMIKSEYRAQKDADKTYPLDDPKNIKSNSRKNIDLNEKLIEKYKIELADQLKLDMAILDSIGIEGLEYGWTFPKY